MGDCKGLKDNKMYKIQYQYRGEGRLTGQNMWYDILELPRWLCADEATEDLKHIRKCHTWAKSPLRVRHIRTGAIIAECDIGKTNDKEEAQPEPAAEAIPVAG